MPATENIKAHARSLGFDAVGIAEARPIPHAEAALKQWIESGYHGEMKYLEDFRARLERLKAEVPGARSIVVLGVNYFTRTPAGNPGHGRVARYAWGKDYHAVIKSRLLRLEEFIRLEVPGARCLSGVDTQPVLERSYAEQAGLGFLGRHTNLLSREFGPWLFLSEIVTDAALTPDGPRDHGDCGTCTACLDVCPTRAIIRPGTIDARLCIAYLTIEHRGVIPREIRPLMKDWIFGCDECLNVCPFTEQGKETGWSEFRAEEGAGRSLDPLSLFEIGSNSQYERKFAGTALLRASRKMMLRNAAVVLGNLREARAVPALARALETEDSLVKIHAAWALGRIGGEESRKALESRALIETGEVLEEIRLALEELAQSSGRR